MKKLIVISEGINTGIAITKQLRGLIGKFAEIENVLLSQAGTARLCSDLILFTTEEVKLKAEKYIDSSLRTMVADRVIDHKKIKDILDIKKGENVLLVNDSYFTAQESIAQLLDLGLDHIKYYPYYPGSISYPELKTIITPGEAQLAPYRPDSLIDINTRILDLKGLYKITYLLELEENIDYSLVKTYIRDIVVITKSINQSKKDLQDSEHILEMMIDNIDYGIGFADEGGMIIRINSKFEYILGISSKDILNHNIEDLLGDDKFFEKGRLDLPLKDTIRIGQARNYLEIKKVDFFSRIGYIIYLKDKKELGSKYKDDRGENLCSFSDYLSQDKKVMEMLRRCQKFSKTESNILIEGETGTGKEILGQAIHKNSHRRDNVFVPINISAFAPSLLESELFGYEEGSFTGALKGGKPGLFEIANGGTIFIDEIGDAPGDVQAKLLRVLEEKRIRRIGAAEEKVIDVRVIAATNKDLLKLIREGRFRMDLFFRLNILPVYTIPLRERKGDINYFLKHYINMNVLKKIDSLEEFFKEETIEFLNNYRWIGNVRELTNLVEYLVLIYENKPLGVDSLHHYMSHAEDRGGRINLNRDELWILGKLYEFKGPLGRVKLKNLAVDEKVGIGEGQIRRILESLKDYGLIDKKDKEGCVINENGIKTYGENQPWYGIS